LQAGDLYFNTTSNAMQVYTGSVWTAAYISGSGFLAAANNLSDVSSTSTARTNLGLGSSSNVTFATVNGLTLSQGGGAIASNVQMGATALGLNTTGNQNTAIGVNALAANTTANDNVALGFDAGKALTTGGSNTAVGNNALGANTTGTYNVGIGRGAGSAITTGSLNTIIGSYSGNAGGLDIRTLSNYTVVSDGDGNLRLVFNNTGAMGLNGANYGTSGQILTSNGSGSAPTWQTNNAATTAIAMAIVFGG
jgi:hypothetical protein